MRPRLQMNFLMREMREVTAEYFAVILRRERIYMNVQQHDFHVTIQVTISTVEKLKDFYKGGEQ